MGSGGAARAESPIALIEAVATHNDWPAYAHSVSFSADVANLCFDKNVTVNYSWDGWNNAFCFPLSWQRSDMAEGREVWGGSLAVPLGTLSLSFSLCFSSPRGTWRDDNGGRNYEIRIPKS
jgi:Putative phosphatase regulatory subunit.